MPGDGEGGKCRDQRHKETFESDRFAADCDDGFVGVHVRFYQGVHLEMFSLLYVNEFSMKQLVTQRTVHTGHAGVLSHDFQAQCLHRAKEACWCDMRQQASLDRGCCFHGGEGTHRENTPEGRTHALTRRPSPASMLEEHQAVSTGALRQEPVPALMSLARGEQSGLSFQIGCAPQAQHLDGPQALSSPGCVGRSPSQRRTEAVCFLLPNLPGKHLLLPSEEGCLR